MRKLCLFMLMLFGITVAFGQKRNSGEKIVKVASSEILWWGYKVVKSAPTTHTGSVKLKSGKFLFKDRVLVGGDFVVDMRSLVNTDLEGEEQKKLTDDLKSVDFFEVKKYPIAKFQMTKLIPSKSVDYNYTVIGNLTMKGVRKTISFPAQIHINEYNVNFESAKFSLDRQDYKVFYRSSIRDYIIKDQIDLKIKMSTN